MLARCAVDEGAYRGAVGYVQRVVGHAINHPVSGGAIDVGGMHCKPTPPLPPRFGLGAHIDRGPQEPKVLWELIGRSQLGERAQQQAPGQIAGGAKDHEA